MTYYGGGFNALLREPGLTNLSSCHSRRPKWRESFATFLCVSAVICLEGISSNDDKPHPQQVVQAQTTSPRRNRSSCCGAGAALLRAIRPQPALRLPAER